MKKLIASILVLLCWVPASFATISILGGSLPASQAISSPNTFAVTSTTGNMEVAIIACDGTATVTSVSDNKSNTWTLNSTHGNQGNSSPGGNIYIAYSFSAATAITSFVVNTTGTGRMTIALHDLSSSTGGALGAINVLNSQSSANPAPSITAAGAGIVIVGEIGWYAASAVSSPFTTTSISNTGMSDVANTAYDVNGSGGTITPTYTITSGDWASVIASFKEVTASSHASQIGAFAVGP